jgi:hypothetical protein
VVNEPVVQVLTTQVVITCSGSDLEDTLFNNQEGDIESSSPKIENEDIVFASGLCIEAVGDRGSSWFVNDTYDVVATDSTSLFGGLTLGVIEASRQ